MSNFFKSQWAQANAAQQFVEEADRIIPERRRLFHMVRDYYRHFHPLGPNRLLELGSGDGLLSEVVAGGHAHASVLLLDGSETMLEHAQQRFQGRARTLKMTFQDLIKNRPDLGVFDFIYSSLAIHHLNWEEKEALYQYCYACLQPGGSLVVLDVVLGQTNPLENWYLDLWKQWLAKEEERRAYQHLPAVYKQKPENTPGPLYAQLQALASIGFTGVDVFYKFGIFCLFGAQRPQHAEKDDEDEDVLWPVGAFLL